MARFSKDIVVVHKKTNISQKTLSRIKNFYERRSNWFELLSLNPYRLSELDGFGFKRCDEIASKIGYDMMSDNRVIACVKYIVEISSAGHTIVEFDKVILEMMKLLSRSDKSRIEMIVKENCDKQDYLLYDSSLKRCINGYNPKYITLEWWKSTEQKIFELCKKADLFKNKKKEEIDKAIANVEKRLEFPLNERQKNAFYKIPHGKVNILTGLGGSGKSYTTRAILDVLDELGESYELLCPTGCATKVLEKSTGRKAMTIHRKYHTDFLNGDFGIESDWLIVDEVSMLSLEHFKMIIEMINQDSIKLLFIGDISQLVPISEGCSFRDLITLIESDMLKGNVIHLTEIMRAKKDSAIPHICKMFTRSGSYSVLETKKEHKGVEFVKIDRQNFLLQIENIIKDRKLDLANTFVLSSLNVRDYGTEAINNHIQKVFSKGEIVYKDKFRVYKHGEYLMHTKNNSRLGIFNGERVRMIGQCEPRIDSDGNETEQWLCVKVDDGVEVKYTEKELQAETRLSYSISIHKSQGSSLENTIVVIDSSHSFSLSRNSVYTAMSRASKNLIVVYDDYALQIASNKNDVEKRNTFLRALWGINMKKRMKGV